MGMRDVALYTQISQLSLDLDSCIGECSTVKVTETMCKIDLQ